MRLISLFMLTMLTIVTSIYAQKDITTWVQGQLDGDPDLNINLILGPTLLAPGDSITEDVVLGDVVLPDGDSDVDTVRSNLFIRAYVSSGTTEVTVSANNGTSKTFDVSLTSEGNVIKNGTIDFYEGDTTTITVKNTSTTNSVTFTRLIFQTGSKTSVISDANYGLFQQEGVSVSNPVSNGTLYINHLPTDFGSATVELINLEGTLMLSKTITQNDASIDVSSLNSGVYLLREAETGFAKKIVIL